VPKLVLALHNIPATYAKLFTVPRLLVTSSSFDIYLLLTDSDSFSRNAGLIHCDVLYNICTMYDSDCSQGAQRHRTPQFRAHE